MTHTSIQKEEGSFQKHNGLKFKKETTKSCIWNIASHSAEIQTLRKVGQF